MRPGAYAGINTEAWNRERGFWSFNEARRVRRDQRYGKRSVSRSYANGFNEARRVRRDQQTQLRMPHDKELRTMLRPLAIPKPVTPQRTR